MAIAAGAALVLAGALAVQPATAVELGPQGGPTAECKAAGYDYGVKLDTSTPGTYVYNIGPWTPTTLDIDLTVTIHADNTFSWTGAVPPVDAVLIKAGQGYTILAGGTSGTGTPSSGKGISHITFCYDDEPYGEPEEHLTVSKTVTTTYDRQHHWTLDKSVDVHDVYLYIPGEGATTGTATWRIDVGYDGPPTDSNFMVSGTITVLNDGDVPVAVADVEDTIMVGDVGTDVMVDCDATFPANLAVGDDIECTYSHAVGSMIDGDNIATATTVGGTEYESLPMPINWGDPTNETDEQVTLTDVSDTNGTQTVTFDAPTGGFLEYSTTFDWADYDYMDECGDFSYVNVATLTSGDSYLELTDTETVNVHVQCYVFQGETAWAANAGAGTLPYNKKGGGNWATYVQYPNTAPVVKTYNVYAGQTMLAGTATVTPVGGGMVTVTVDLTGDWEFADVASNLKIQTYGSAPSGNPSPGSFMYKTTCTMDPCTSGPIPVAKFYGIHMDVGVWVPDPMFGV